MSLHAFIQHYCAFGSEVNGQTIHYGKNMTETLDQVYKDIPDGFLEEQFWANNIRRCWVNGNDRTFITYCNGLVLVRKFSTDEAYNAEYFRLDKAYNKPCASEKVLPFEYNVPVHKRFSSIAV